MRARLTQVRAALPDPKGSALRLAKALFPPELVAYIPGQKLVAAAVLYLAATLLGFDSTHVVSIPGLADFTVEDAAAFIGFFFWPTNKPVVEPGNKRR